MVDLAQHGLGPVAGETDFFLRQIVLALQAASQQGVVQGRAQQRGEILRHVLDDIIGRAGAKRRHRDPAFLGAGDIDDRRRRVQRQDVGQDVQSVARRHIVIQGADVVFVQTQQFQPGVAVGRAGDGVTVTRQLLLDQPGQAPVVVDVKQANGLIGLDHSISGAWITDRNSPSWRIAPAKDS